MLVKYKITLTTALEIMLTEKEPETDRWVVQLAMKYRREIFKIQREW